MDKKQMEEYFKMVGFDPSSTDKKSGDAGASPGKEGKRARGQRVPFEAGKDAAGGSPFGGGNPFAGFGGHGHDGGSGDGSSFDFDVPALPRKTLIVLIAVLVAIIAIAYWWFHPPINIHSSDLWVFLAIFVILPSFITFRTISRSYATGDGKRERSEKKAARFKHLSWVPVAVAVVGIVGAVASYSIWPGNAEKYASLLHVEDSDFASDIQEVDYNSIPVIDKESSVLLGNRTLGEIPEYVSQFEISNIYSQINYQGRPVRVSPLEYADLFKWFYNKDTGVPAYVLVDMASQDTQVVRLDQPIYYVDSEPLERNIDRYVQLKYPFYMFEEKSFEIDEDGTPWWICPVQDRTIGLFGGETISRVVLVNASTGETQDYAIGDVPQWVDRAYPSDLVVQQYNWYGSLKGGWLNSWLGQSGVVQTTPGTDGNAGYNYIAKDDDVWLYSGVTSATADNAIVGFVLVNQRTAETHYYSVAGATEESAMKSAEGQVQNLGYHASFPLLLNINGQPTYFMALKDDAGLAKKFAMIDIQRYQNVAIGDTVADCQKSYKALLATNGAVGAVDESSLQKADGQIRTISQAVVDSNTHFYLTLEGDGNIYDFPLPSMIDVVRYGVGDDIAFTYVDGDPTCTVQSIESSAAGGSDASATASGSSSQADDTAAASNGATSSDASSASSSAQAAA
ncbi:MAG: Tat pathway signal sequence [Eggerthellaceae bacterium]|nr:Tat pathway signal sequence [Eggerthellaceae bacterium]